MTAAEIPLLFECAGANMIGVLHQPSATPPRSVALLIPVGGPTYRVGAARQYVDLARRVASAGFPVLRFDYRGVGDSEASYPGLQGLKPDFEAAIAALKQNCPQVRHIVPWGLCEAASAILLHCPDMPDVAGAILANPWLDDEAVQARGLIRQHYRNRLFSKSFWKRLLSGGVALPSAVGGLWRTWRQSRTGGRQDSLSQRMAVGLSTATQPLLCLLSSADDTAAAFRHALDHAPQWRQAQAKAKMRLAAIDDADHVFSDAHSRQAVAAECIAFLEEIANRAASGGSV